MKLIILSFLLFSFSSYADLRRGEGADLPAGTSIIFKGLNCPTGFLLENNAAISRTGYSKLFTAIGTTYGAGDGSTTFNLPNSAVISMVTETKTYSVATNTNATVFIEYSLIGDKLFVNGRIMWSGNGTTANPNFTLPDGLSIKTSAAPNFGLTIAYGLDVGNQQYPVWVTMTNANTVAFSRLYSPASAGLAILSDYSLPWTPNSGDYISFSFTITVNNPTTSNSKSCIKY